MIHRLVFRRRCLALLATALLPLAAAAHDSWLQPQPASAQLPAHLLLGTGNQFPVMESAIDAPYLVRPACQRGEAAPRAMQVGNLTEVAIRLRPAPEPGVANDAPVSCWLQTSAFDVELPKDKIPVYIAEVRPTPAVLAAWAAMRERGLPWRERYVKHARIEQAGSGAGSAAAPASDLGMDALLQGGRQPRRVGDTLTVQLLRDGQPLADQAVEWRHERGRVGIWRRTDAQGLVSLAPTLAGRWLLRGVDLRLSDTRPDEFDSRFITLALEVLPR